MKDFISISDKVKLRLKALTMRRGHLIMITGEMHKEDKYFIFRNIIMGYFNSAWFMTCFEGKKNQRPN
jgi:hypothetical protein